MSHQPRLFIPGPTEVFPEILAEVARPVISHRGPEIVEITNEVLPNLKRLFLTESAECYVATSSATGLMEGAIRNLAGKRVLCTICGAFSDRMATVARKNGAVVDELRVESGEAITAEAVREAMAKADYDMVTVVHSETSTGVLNPIAEIGAVVRDYADALLVVDVVSSLSGAEFRFDEWGVDLAFAGVQKCIALPPGITVFAASERAMARAESQPDRGHYFDFLNYRKMATRGQMPATCCVSLVVALRAQLRRILDDEGLDERWKRHRAMAALTRDRLGDRFSTLPHAAFATPTESVFVNDRGISIADLVTAVSKKGMLFGNGYGALKEKTFRVGHMGDLQAHHVERFLETLLEALDEAGVGPRGDDTT